VELEINPPGNRQDRFPCFKKEKNVDLSRLTLQLEHYIHKPSGQGILQALHSFAGGDFEVLSKLADERGLDALERTQLRAFLTQVGATTIRFWNGSAQM